MKIRTALLAGASLLAMTAHAHAFEAIGSVVISALLSVGAGGLLPTASAAAIGLGAVGLASTVAQIALQAAFLGRRPSANPQDIKNTSAGTEGPGRYATGRVKLGGKVAFGNTAEYDIYRLLLHCFGRIDAIEEYFYDGRSIVVDSDGTVTSPPWATQGGSNLFIESKLGTGNETAWNALESDFPSIWTSDHRVRGIGQSLLRAVNPGTGEERFQTLFQGGVKELEVLARVGRFHDPRTGSSEWTLNGVLQVLHWFRQLPGIGDAIIDFDDIEDAADEAETNVDTLDGSAPKCRLSGGWEGPLTYKIVEDMLESAGLEVRQTDDELYTLRFLEDNPDSELTLYSRHIIDRDFQSGEESAKRPNLCRVKYFAPERQYEVAEIDLSGVSWARVQDEIDVYGDHEYPVELVFCTDASQAQRIARRKFWMARADTGIVKTHFAGRACWNKRTVTIEVPDVGEDGDSIFVKCWIMAPPRINDNEGTVEIPVAIIPDELKTAWSPATMEAEAPPVLENYEYESELDTPDTPSDAVVVEYPGGGFETRIAFSGVSGGTTAEANYREYDDGTPEQWASMTEYDGDGSTGWYAWVSGDSRDRADFRVRFFNDDGEGSYFSELREADPLTIDNSATDEPDVTETTTQSTPNGVDGADLDIIAPETRAVKVLVEYRDNRGIEPEWTEAETLNDIRPGVERTVSIGPFDADGQTVDWRVSSFTSDDTQGVYETGQIQIYNPGS